jgi:hypothetical protein
MNTSSTSTSTTLGTSTAYINPSSYSGNMFKSAPLAMDTGGKTGILSGGGGGIYHGFDGNRAGYDLSAYHNNYVPQETGNHAMQRLSPLSGGSKWGKRGRPRATRRRSRRSRRSRSHRGRRSRSHRGRRISIQRRRY